MRVFECRPRLVRRRNDRPNLRPRLAAVRTALNPHCPGAVRFDRRPTYYDAVLQHQRLRSNWPQQTGRQMLGRAPALALIRAPLASRCPGLRAGAKFVIQPELALARAEQYRI